HDSDHSQRNPGRRVRADLLHLHRGRRDLQLLVPDAVNFDRSDPTLNTGGAGIATFTAPVEKASCMDLIAAYASAIAGHWPFWLVTVVLIVAAVIDGYELRVPNLITYPFLIGGWAYSLYAYGLEGLGWSLAGTVLGMSILMLFYVIGGMGAGDVKLMG